MPLFKWYQEKKEQRLKAKGHPLNHLPQKKPYPSILSIHPQPQSPFFARLPLEIRLIIYELLFGNRSLHYECDWLEDEKRWRIYSYGCFVGIERVDLDHCAGHLRHAPSMAKYWGLWIDVGLLFSCWKAYTESLQVLYATNEFRFSKCEALCRTFPQQIPAQGLINIHRLTFWWPLDSRGWKLRGLQPHVSPQNRSQYDELWTALKTKFVGLTHIRIFIDLLGLSAMEGDGEENKLRYIQQAWLDGMESMVESMGNLELFELHIHRKVYRVLRDRVKPWLKQKQEERRKEKRTDRIRYKAYKCGNTFITHQSCFGTSSGYRSDISEGSSHIGIRDPRSAYDEFWMKKRRER